MPKVIGSGVREVVFKVKEFFKKEKEADDPIIPFERVNERVSAATGVSLRTVARIVCKDRLAESSSSKIVTPGKDTKLRQDKKIGEVVLKVKEFFKTEKLFDAPIIPFERVNERVAAATGVSVRTVARIINEGRLAESLSSKIVTAGINTKQKEEKKENKQFLDIIYAEHNYL